VNNKRRSKISLYIILIALLCFVDSKIFYVQEADCDLNVKNALTITPETAEPLTNGTYIIEEWVRKISIDPWDAISSSDYYLIFNNQSEEIRQVSLVLPINASDISVRDAYGEYKTGTNILFRENYIQVDVTLKKPLNPRERNEFLIAYKLPPSEFLVSKSWQDYVLELDLAKPENWTVNKFSLMISLPEGAELKDISDVSFEIKKEGLSLKIILTEHNVVKFRNPHIVLEYRYFILWKIFKPLIWAVVLASLGAVVFFVRKSTRPAVTTVTAPPDILREFIKVYEERRRLYVDLQSLQRQFRRGKISRKRLKLRKKSLDQRLAALNKRLMELKEQISALAEQYREMLRDLETAEAEIEMLNTNIEQVEARFRRGEISADTRKKLIDEYNGIKRRAEGRISEILLRLQEETM